jgi:hypothetical protein
LKKEILLVVVALLVVGILGVTYVTEIANNPAQGTTSSSTTGSTFASGISPDGLQLVMALNTTSIHFHGAIAAKVYVLNTHGSNVSSVPPAVSNLQEGCGGYAFGLIGFALYEGHYTQTNISTAVTPLNLYAPLFVECPAFPLPTNVVFSPHSDKAMFYFKTNGLAAPPNGTVLSVGFNVTTQTCGPSSSGFNCNGFSSLNGYWNASTPIITQPTSSMLKYFDYFQTGEYTLVATDSWNQTVYAGFEVVA